MTAVQRQITIKKKKKKQPNPQLQISPASITAFSDPKLNLIPKKKLNLQDDLETSGRKHLLLEIVIYKSITWDN